MATTKVKIPVKRGDGVEHDCSSWRTKMERQMAKNTKICLMNQTKMVENTMICLETQSDVLRAHECLDQAHRKIDELSTSVETMTKRVAQTGESMDTLTYNLSAAVWISKQSQLARVKAVLIATFVKDGVVSLSALAAALVPVIALSIALYEIWVWYKTGVVPHIPFS